MYCCRIVESPLVSSLSTISIDRGGKLKRLLNITLKLLAGGMGTIIGDVNQKEKYDSSLVEWCKHVFQFRIVAAFQPRVGAVITMIDTPG
jgi:hypothetical protein